MGQVSVSIGTHQGKLESCRVWWRYNGLRLSRDIVRPCDQKVM